MSDALDSQLNLPTLRKVNSSDQQEVTSVEDLEDYVGPTDLPPLDIPKHITVIKIPVFNRFCTIGKSEDMKYAQGPSYNVIELHRDGDSWIID